MLKSRKRIKHNRRRSTNMRGAGWWDDLKQNTSSSISQITTHPTFLSIQQGFNDIGNKASGFFSDESNNQPITEEQILTPLPEPKPLPSYNNLYGGKRRTYRRYRH